MVAIDPNIRALDLLGGAEAGFALSVLDSSPDCIKILDLDGQLRFMNGNGLCAMEIDDFASVDRRAWPALWPAAAHHLLNGALEAARQGQVTRFEAFCPTAKGTPRWWHVTVSPIRDRSGAVTRILASSRDVTDMAEARARLEEEIAKKDAAIARQKVLMGEIDHRVKNSFASVIGLLRMQARMQSTGQGAPQLLDAANRIATLARVHDQLYLDPGARDVSLRDYVAGLAADLAQALNVRVSTHDRLEEGHRVSPGQAAAIGQILAELIGNAAKHGHPGHHPSMELTLEQQGRQLRLSLVDDGPGLPEGFDPDHSSGLGMQICLIYARQMDGRLDHGAGPQGGARFDVTLRLDNGIAA